jgi:tetratricopeptide (TPR) repeat protein
MRMTALFDKPRRVAALLAAALALAGAGAVRAAPMDSSGTAAKAPDTSDLAKGMDAWEARDWDGVIDHMSKVVAANPTYDMVWTRLGYAYRQVSAYDKSLAAYDQALSINPSNRGALEYLGEAYLQMGKPEEARKVAARLAAECRKASPGSAGKFPEGCEEMALLKKNFEALGLKLGS